MKLLAFESSAKAASTALLSDGCLLAEYTQNSGQTHSRTLMDKNLPLRLLPEHLCQQKASGVALAAMERISAGEPGDAAALTPNYLRQAQAERTRQHDKDFYLKK